MSVVIKSVDKHSIADKNHIESGDILISINGNDIHDVLDYMFYISEENIKIELSRNNEPYSLSIHKSEYDDLGLEFSSFLMDEKQSCKNKCVFCFIDQNPPGLRETLYFKDDDDRLSFLHGNYITLTNLKDCEIDRIIRMHLNINISVHTTNPELRSKMMNNRFAGEKLKYLKKLADNEIQMNCQIVLCPGLNDGKELERTLTDLSALMPSVQSIAVVPVGLTKYREGLYPLTLFNKETASKAIDIIETYQQKFLKEYDTRLVFAADEFYIKAEREIPSTEYYEDYPQFENGVGIIRSMTDEFMDEIKYGKLHPKYKSVSLVTGMAAIDYITNLVNIAMDKWNNFKCEVYPIRNDFFGENITVSGLLTGQDIIAQLKGKELGEHLFLPEVAIKEGTDLFLDDYTITQLENELGIKVSLIPNDGAEFLKKIMGY